MVSDKPPRRSRSGKTPVTIDLAAENATPIAEPVRSNDTDTVSETLPADATEPTAADPAKSAENEVGRDTILPEAAVPVDTTDAEARASVEEPHPLDEPVTPAREPELGASQNPAAPRPEEEPAVTEPPATSPFDPIERTQTSKPDEPSAAAPAPVPAPTPKTPALVACGIVGGVVALLLAGSMQYAGVIPSFGSQPSAATQGEIDALRQEIAASRASAGGDLEQRIRTLETAANGNGANQLQQQVASLQSELNTLKNARQAEGDTAARLDQRFEALEAKVDQPGREQAVARALAAAALKAATERGGSFAAELQTFGQVAADDPAVAELRPYAEQGVPTRADLIRRAPAAVSAILDAAHQPVEGEGVTSRLLSSAMRVVKVRPVGEVEGETPEAIAARIEAKVKNGDLKAAAAEWNTLPEGAKQASAEFKRGLDARIAVEDLMNATLTRAMASAGSNG